MPEWSLLFFKGQRLWVVRWDFKLEIRFFVNCKFLVWFRVYINLEEVSGNAGWRNCAVATRSKKWPQNDNITRVSKQCFIFIKDFFVHLIGCYSFTGLQKICSGCCYTFGATVRNLNHKLGPTELFYTLYASVIMLQWLLLFAMF